MNSGVLARQVSWLNNNGIGAFNNLPISGTCRMGLLFPQQCLLLTDTATVG
jgi:hypothetical protein